MSVGERRVDDLTKRLWSHSCNHPECTMLAVEAADRIDELETELRGARDWSLERDRQAKRIDELEAALRKRIAHVVDLEAALREIGDMDYVIAAQDIARQALGGNDE